MKTDRTERSRTVLFCIFTAVYVCMIVYGAQVRRGVSDALALCAGMVVPSLFPMLILTAFLSRIGIPRKAEKLLFRPVGRLTGLSSDAAPAVFFGLTGGYPVGVKTAAAAYSENRLAPSHAKRAALFCVHPGAAFSVLTVGKGFGGSVVTGLLLYFSVLLADLILGYLLRLFSPLPAETETAKREREPPGDALVGAVTQAVGNMLSVCAWIVAFSGFTALIRARFLTEKLRLIPEVTQGVKTAMEARRPADGAFALGFGGLSVFFQLLPDLKTLGVWRWLFVAGRAFCGLLSEGVFALLSRLLPVGTKTFAAGSFGVRFGGASPVGSAFLLFFCAVFMFSVRASPKKTVIVKKHLPSTDSHAKI